VRARLQPKAERGIAAINPWLVIMHIVILSARGKHELAQ
jgi:hypothetical protein